MRKKVFTINILFFLLIILVIAISNAGYDKSDIDENSDAAKLVLVDDVIVRQDTLGTVVYAELKNRSNEDLKNINLTMKIENSKSHAIYTIYSSISTLDAKDTYVLSLNITTSAIYDRCTSFSASIKSSTGVMFELHYEREFNKSSNVGNIIGYIIPVWVFINILAIMFFILKKQKGKKYVSVSASSYSYTPSNSVKSIKKVKCPFCGRKYYPTGNNDTCPSCGGINDVY